jgi:hypothetical protein
LVLCEAITASSKPVTPGRLATGLASVRRPALPNGVVVLEELSLTQASLSGMNTIGSPLDGHRRRVAPRRCNDFGEWQDDLQFEAGGDVGHRLIVTARDLASSDEIGRIRV